MNDMKMLITPILLQLSPAASTQDGVSSQDLHLLLIPLHVFAWRSSIWRKHPDTRTIQMKPL